MRISLLALAACLLPLTPGARADTLRADIKSSNSFALIERPPCRGLAPPDGFAGAVPALPVTFRTPDGKIFTWGRAASD